MKLFMLKQRGFTLIELMMVIGIIGILASVATPMYMGYTRKAKFNEVIYYTAGYKADVRLCIQVNNTTTDCTGGENGVREDLIIPQGYIKSVIVKDGKITSTAIDELQNITYVLSPSYDEINNNTDWTVSGTCLTNRFCR